MNTKYCPDCKRDKPVRSFYVDRRAATGLSTYCKVHQRARVANTAAKEEYKEKQAKWRAAFRERHPGYMTEYMREYREKLRNTLQHESQL